MLPLLLVSCSNYNRILKGNNHDLQLETASKLYEKGSYSKALQLLDELLPFYRGTDKAEKILFMYAYCYYNQGDYEMASYHFKSFSNTFPTSPKAEECLFMNAYCYFYNSADYSLDQTNTQRAIDELQLFINIYPRSKHIEESNNLIDELHLKLETKDFEIAKLYYNMAEYKAAVISLGNVIKDFPTTFYKEESLFLIVKSNYLLAKKSIDSKKYERYKSTVDAFAIFAAKFPESKYLKEAQSISNSAQKELKNLTPNT